MGRLKTLGEMQAERERRRHTDDAILALVKRAGKLPIPIDALQDLQAGDSMSITVLPGEGLLLEYVRVEPEAG